MKKVNGIEKEGGEMKEIYKKMEERGDSEWER